MDPFAFDLPDPESLSAVYAARYGDESRAVRALLPLARLSAEEQAYVEGQGEFLLDALRASRRERGGADALFAAFPLASPAGRALLTLAEALLRIPDAATADRLIRDQLHEADWQAGDTSPSWLVNLARWGLDAAEHWSETRSGKPIVRYAMQRAMHGLGARFVLGETIAAAIQARADGFHHSFDMLGEAALTAEDAERYAEAYAQAIGQLATLPGRCGARSACGISIKLSALHPRVEPRQWPRIRRELYPRLLVLARMARDANLPLTIDAEESERLPLTLALFGRLLHEPSLAGWDGLGIAVQAYQKSALAQLDWLIAQAATAKRRIVVRLVKGAYWDGEIKRAQLEAWPDYPVFTRKAHSDASFLACARQMLRASEVLYPAFATHNAFTALAVHALAGARDFEFQCLFGMGEPLYRLLAGHGIERPCRVYAPVGRYASLLPYLVRRLLENGANQSFVHQLLSDAESTPALRDPVTASARQPATDLPAPMARAGHDAVAAGISWSDVPAVTRLAMALQQELAATAAGPLLAHGTPSGGAPRSVLNPARLDDVVGTIADATPCDVEHALQQAQAYAPTWAATPVAARASLLQRAADEFDRYRPALIALLVREAGKSLIAANNEVREAIDFCRYYANQAAANWPDRAPAPWGAVAAISPWNFPLAIFVGQIAAALVAGNTVLAKPAEETPLTAYLATRLLHEAGIPHGALQLLPGGPEVGAVLTQDTRISGVLFTGSLPTAQAIHRALAKLAGERVLVAETGGVNAMLIDSSALPEQVVQDVLASAFDSAGQRCSALRVLCLPEAMAPSLLPMLQAAMRELAVGDPSRFDTDLGPVISDAARDRIEAAVAEFSQQGLAVFRTGKLPASGHYVAPTLVEIATLAQMPGEIFGPVLAILRYQPDELDTLLPELDALGYGLTLAVASRCPSFIGAVIEGIRVGNVYVNRNQIGAVVGHQPFGGERRSGTGPKAGGPWLLWRLVRNADPCRAAPGSGHRPEAALLAFTESMSLPLQARLRAIIETLFDHSPLAQRISLPAPVGETNTLAYRPRGRVACLAAAPTMLLPQLAACLATGNRAILPARVAPASWLAPFTGLVAVEEEPLAGACDAVLWDGNGSDPGPRLAEQPGPILQPIHPLSDGSYPLYRLVTEVTVTINTAAAGGDAELLGRPA
ncbi:bifunctional proline dehydrogenase/L-glutamate gamma-semialdehyde dehydrogenase PutA [Chitinolyticbacter meiyuanensis]|uniref:bifunctional proline dehydrogenase/L-glutamate gamma-semialdehyde dehydrogenase PutA n=1 Tax=Chitinolyticbacter meiyuanensis TaxID=682798 RepID=UPI0011E5C12A|nr:bifunctional proline dehydrogenase/L-glutamate gamma-semialdehyde dehydrogenase PutA [Chitinolyticbacter meiyuanensis]